jgi:carboxymethylenebutenolidase
MCHESTASPAVYGRAVTRADAEPVTLTSADGTQFAGFLARPERHSGAGVVVLPDARGLGRFYEELAVHLAEQGHVALAIDYFGRTAGADTRDRGADFPFMEHVVRLSRPSMQEDLEAGIAVLRSPRGGDCQAAFALGFCMGGRSAFLAAAPRFGLAGVIGFYGAPGIAGPYGPGPTQHAQELRAPVLGLFGGADEGIPQSEVDAFDAALTAADVEHEVVTYPGAPHGFFEMRQESFADASRDAWHRTLTFIQLRTDLARTGS